MGWTWYADSFDRSDRPLHREPVDGTLPARWEVYLLDDDPDTAARIVSGAPRPGVTPGSSVVFADLAELTGDPIVGVGIEARFASLGTPSSSGAHFGDLFAAFPPSANGTGILLETDFSTASLYRVRLSTDPPGGWSIGQIQFGGRSPLDPVPIDWISTEDVDRNFPKWAVGTTVRLEVEHAGQTRVYYNGALHRTKATPSGMTAAHSFVGAAVSPQWNLDDWRIGVLT